jgi:2-keto-3-deoxy-L-rhamnonate aldolase RhmA
MGQCDESFEVLGSGRRVCPQFGSRLDRRRRRSGRADGQQRRGCRIRGDGNALPAKRDAVGRPYRAPRGSPLCIVQIETREGVDHVEEIAAVDGVDSLMIGPGDLALSIGRIPGVDSHHDDMKALYHRVIETCSDVGKPAGTFALLGAEDAERTWELNWD